ncbi:unnamed protein product [Larinioides sclopetarius]|uniref:Ig-like domain-containing protein n=1 Tax=Larinioides sclopetarius TaxID=280406 RepID=A0AAV1Z5A1_9ARAC
MQMVGSLQNYDMTRVLPFKAYFFELLVFLLITSMPAFDFGHHIPLKINMFYVPSPSEVGDSVLLRCDYELGNEALYALKFYKNMIEFFRYAPEDHPSIMIFLTPGVNVDLSKSGNSSVYLRNLTLESSGNYTCEVSSGPPYFSFKQITKQLKVEDSRHHIPLEIKMLHIPSPAVVGDSILLRCDYDLGDETLYNVKFYKDLEEFYIYYTKRIPSMLVFPQPGVNVDLSKSGNSSVYLRNLTLESAGSYTCEVTSDAPSFFFDIITKQLEVVVPPSEGPVLTEENSDYKIGENVSIRCHSGKSKPAPDLKWYINDQPVISHLHNKETIVHPDQLESSSLALSFRLMSDEIQNGKVTVKCVATVKHISAETSIEITASGFKLSAFH